MVRAVAVNGIAQIARVVYRHQGITQAMGNRDRYMNVVAGEIHTRTALIAEGILLWSFGIAVNVTFPAHPFLMITRVLVIPLNHVGRAFVIKNSSKDVRELGDRYCGNLTSHRVAHQVDSVRNHIVMVKHVVHGANNIILAFQRSVGVFPRRIWLRSTSPTPVQLRRGQQPALVSGRFADSVLTLVHV